MRTDELEKWKEVKVKGLFGVGRIVDFWTIGSETFVKVKYFRKSGKVIAERVVMAENILPHDAKR